MKNFMQKILGVFAILGAVMGAGFMTGTEIYSFFVKYGSISYITIAINCAIFAVFVAIYGSKNAKDAIKWPYNNIKINLLPVCQIVLTASMMAGASQIFASMGLNKMLASFIVFLFVCMCLIVGIKSANFFNVATTACALFSFMFLIYDGEINWLSAMPASFSAFAMAIFYASMNIATSTAVVERVASNSTKKQIKIIAVAVFVVLILISYLLAMVLPKSNQSMPLLSVIKNKTFSKIYLAIVIMAMVSTMLSSGFGAKKMFAGLGNFFGSIMCALVCYLVSFCGFDFIVNYLYPVVGVIVIVQGILNIIFKFSNKKLIYA